MKTNLIALFFIVSICIALIENGDARRPPGGRPNGPQRGSWQCQQISKKYPWVRKIIFQSSMPEKESFGEDQQNFGVYPPDQPPINPIPFGSVSSHDSDYF
ncbi:hypothetical protein NH340_JMT07809 [Sarcoptes scabiei]|uniref:Uncharacterized protein n=1 Tax=Sarcoptes scabiei TaxID=52283 RepID=A0A132AII7_SARSC|nr:hypothetical protein QR98_0093810 [Sarcoptes scabiei]UXI21866.1 hypothetical protein NH340_JMT07809 [Sarcoptes scabiei]